MHDALVAGLSMGSSGFLLQLLVTAQKPEAAQAASSVQERPPIGGEEPYAGNWKPWVLRSGREIRLPPPAAVTSAQGRRELAQLKQAQLDRTEAQIDAARRWDAGAATRRWTEIHLDMIKTHRPNPPRASRGLALMHIAMYDALIAAWSAKYAYGHPAPSSVDSTLIPVVPLRGIPSYPSEHAVVAGAASQVLSYLFAQQAPAWFEATAQEAAMSRIWAGVDWPGAVDQGLALGRTVATRVLARAATDGSDTVWDGKRPTGVCFWKPTPPGVIFPPLDRLGGR